MNKTLEQSSLIPLTEYAKRVWSAPSLDAKRQIIHEAIAVFKFKGKAERFRRQIDAECKASRLDQFAANLVLLESGDKVIH